jgi:large subunit ribosomal protein L4
MAKLDVLDWKKKKTGDVEVPEKMINEELRKDVLHSLVRWQLASRRSGTHNTKNRGAIAYSSKKPYKQKGTGSARQGNKASMLLRGGAVAHGPHPRDYSFSMNKKVKQLGLRSAISYLNKEGRMFVVNELASKDGKTNELAKRIKDFGLNKVLMIDEKQDEMFARASRNIPQARYNSVEGLNVYDLLKYDAVIFSQNSLGKVAEKCGVQ